MVFETLEKCLEAGSNVGGVYDHGGSSRCRTHGMPHGIYEYVSDILYRFGPVVSYMVSRPYMIYYIDISTGLGVGSGSMGMGVTSGMAIFRMANGILPGTDVSILLGGSYG